MRLGELTAEDVSVQLVSGDVDADDEMHHVRINELAPTGRTEGDAQEFSVRAVSHFAGPVGYTVRVVPKNALMASSAELGLAAVANGAALES